MVKGNMPMDLSPLQNHDINPIIRQIDHYLANRNNAHMIEFRVGTGSVLATGLGVLDRLEDRVEARYLLESNIRYAKGHDFSPRAEVPRRELTWLFGSKKVK